MSLFLQFTFSNAVYWHGRRHYFFALHLGGSSYCAEYRPNAVVLPQIHPLTPSTHE